MLSTRTNLEHTISRHVFCVVDQSFHYTQYYIQWIPKQRTLAALSFKLISENKIGLYSHMIGVEMRNHGKEWEMSHWETIVDLR